MAEEETLSGDEVLSAMEEIAGEDIASESGEPDESANNDETTDETTPEEAEAVDENAEADDPDAEMIEWGEGDDAKKAKLEDVIAAYEQSSKPVDFSTNPEYLNAVNQMGESARHYQQNSQQLAQYASQMQMGYNLMLTKMHPGEAPNPMGLSTEDYNLLKHDYDLRSQEYAQAYGEVQQLSQGVQQQAQAATQQTVQAEMHALATKWPEWNDSKVQQEAYSILGEYGFAPNELQTFTDHRLHLVLKDLMEFRGGRKAGNDAVSTIKSKAAPKRVKSRVTKKTSGSAALNKLRGKVDKGEGLSADEAVMMFTDT